MKTEIVNHRIRQLLHTTTLLIAIGLAALSPVRAAQCTPVSTVQGQLLIMDCTTLGYNPDGTIRFTHRAACLARARRDHHRLLFPAPDGFLHDIEFDLFLDNAPHRLTGLTPPSRNLLFRALQLAALTNTPVYIAVTGPFTRSDKSFAARSVKILSAQPPYRSLPNRFMANYRDPVGSFCQSRLCSSARPTAPCSLPRSLNAAPLRSGDMTAPPSAQPSPL